MKKIFKFFATVASLAAVAGGAFLVYKKFFANEEEDFDFDDSFDEDEDPTASREYVSINITGDDTEVEEESEDVETTEDAAETTADETTDAE